MTRSREAGGQPAPALITFLGKGRYDEVVYRVGEWEVRTPYVAHALSEALRPARVDVLATDEAWEVHGEALAHTLPQAVALHRRAIPAGASSEELWAVFAELLESLQSADGPVVLDITHGFRSLPFFAAACVAYLQALDALPDGLQVVYGAYEAPDARGVRPVWVLDAFVDLLAWAHGAAVLLASGSADRLLAVFRRQEDQVRKRLVLEGARRFPPLGKLRGALERFNADYLTVRAASLLRGFRRPAPGVGGPRSGSARALSKALEAYGEACGERLPALAPVLDCLRELVAGLDSGSLHGEEGDRAMERLARLYLAHGRYAEAAVVVREAWISRYAEGPSAVEAGEEGFERDARLHAETAWARLCGDARTVADVRNDLEHAGFSRQPAPGDRLRARVAGLLDRFAETRNTRREAGREDNRPARTLLVTRHAGAKVWIERQGIALDEVRDHLDVDEVRAGDRIVGTLPAHLAAEVCERGAEYVHLALDLPSGMRGRELSAEDLDRLGARLVPLVVRWAGG